MNTFFFSAGETKSSWDLILKDYITKNNEKLQALFFFKYTWVDVNIIEIIMYKIKMYVIGCDVFCVQLLFDVGFDE